MPGPVPQPTKLKLLRGNPGKRPLPKGDPAARDWLGRYVLKDERLRELAGLPTGSGKSIDEMLREMSGG